MEEYINLEPQEQQDRELLQYNRKNLSLKRMTTLLFIVDFILLIAVILAIVEWLSSTT